MSKKDGQWIGAHLSTAGGLIKTLERAYSLDANTIQIFASNPRGWSGSPISESEARQFLEAKNKYGVEVLVIHAIYLINLASPKKDVYQKSITALTRDLISAGRLKVKHVVLHPGSDLGESGGIDRLVAGLKQVETMIPEGCKILLEGMAGTKNSLGSFKILKNVLNQTGKKHFGICLDTAHLFASGYDLRKKSAIEKMVDDIRRTIGLRTVGCLHLNDSKQRCGSRRDHHENLGAGYIGKSGLVNMLGLEIFRHCPLIMETPGFDNNGPDLKNMKRLKQYLMTSKKLNQA